MAALEQVFAETMPREMGFDYNGMSFQEKEAQEGVPASVIFGLSLLVVFLILAAQYESWSLPFSVLLGIPIAVFGAFLALWLRAFENNVFAQIGLVTLIGLAAKNAILIVEFAKHEHERGKAPADAALAGAKLRLRPILMTAFAFILGVVPLAISTGSGAEARKLLGTAVIGGMLAASLIAIFLIPVSFYVVERLASRGEREAGGGAAGCRAAPRPSREAASERAARARARAVVAAALGCAVGPELRAPRAADAARLPRHSREAHGLASPTCRGGRCSTTTCCRRSSTSRSTTTATSPTAAANVEQRATRAAVQRGELFPQLGYEADAFRGNDTTLGRPDTGPLDGQRLPRAAQRVLGDRRLGPHPARHRGGARASCSPPRRSGAASCSRSSPAWRRPTSSCSSSTSSSRSRAQSVSPSRRRYDLFERQYRGGVVSKLDPLRGEAALAQAAARVPDLERQIVAKENELSRAARAPGRARSRAAARSTTQTVPPEVPAGVPVAAARAPARPDRGRADRWSPRTPRSAWRSPTSSRASDSRRVAGSAERRALATCSTPGTGFWSIGGQALGPLFTFGQTSYTWKAAQAATVASRAAYEGVGAHSRLREVSDALTAREKLVAVRAEQEREVAALRESVRRRADALRRRARDLPRGARRAAAALPAEFALAQVERDQLLAVVQLYRALGGGWNAYDEPPEIPQPIAP